MNHSETESTTDAGPVEPDLTVLDRQEPTLTLEGRNDTKAVIRRYDTEGKRIAVKDYRGSRWWTRATLGRYLIRRESLGYRWAGPVDGIPRFMGRLGPVTLATEWVDATPLARFGAGGTEPLSPELFDRLDRIIGDLHDRKLALADLHHRDVLVNAEGAVHVVDLAMAYRFRERPAVLRPQAPLDSRWPAPL